MFVSLYGQNIIFGVYICIIESNTWDGRNFYAILGQTQSNNFREKNSEKDERPGRHKCDTAVALK